MARKIYLISRLARLSQQLPSIVSIHWHTPILIYGHRIQIKMYNDHSEMSALSGSVDRFMKDFSYFFWLSEERKTNDGWRGEQNTLSILPLSVRMLCSSCAAVAATAAVASKQSFDGFGRSCKYIKCMAAVSNTHTHTACDDQTNKEYTVEKKEK